MTNEIEFQIMTALDELMHKENNIKIFNNPQQISEAMKQISTRIYSK